MTDPNKLTALNEERALDHVAAITGAEATETEQQSLLSRGVHFMRDIGSIALNGQMGELMTAALRRTF